MVEGSQLRRDHDENARPDNRVEDVVTHSVEPSSSGRPKFRRVVRIAIMVVVPIVLWAAIYITILAVF